MNPNDPDFYFILGTALRKLGRTKESQAALNKSEDIHRAEQSEPRDMGDPAGPGMKRHAARLDHDEKP
jgi:hypothetical protein